MSKEFIFSSESVTEGHPDKVCDRVSDSVLDAVLSQDQNGRVACETASTTGIVFVCGEITFNGNIDVQDIVRSALCDIGYTNPEFGIDGNTCAVVSAIHKQSPDISQGVTAGQGLFKEQGAGDQGMMFGYACRETNVLMPLPIMLAHRLTERLSVVRKKKILPWVRPDGKSQVSVKYVNGKPVSVEAVVISTQHDPNVSHSKITKEITKQVIEKVIPKKMTSRSMKVYVNPTGRFVVGGPHGDSGLTGRKIIVDTYGGAAPHGGGAFSGKDPSKVDRSATYAARWVAKNIVAAGLCDKAQIQVAYAIGVAQPVSVMVETFGTAKISEERIEKAVREVFDLRPAAIIKDLNLRRPIYSLTSAYGHFGRELPEFTWEKTNRVKELLRAVK
ncbi:MAG: methionine adenosyltransferase [Candidatus Hydrogenedentes bacterium CG1_02_42_14]|nr:MAG: methionine adenosyltransferase [Candidatus Hydrogenedentes bacterium CG1_02_42_14]